MKLSECIKKRILFDYETSWMVITAKATIGRFERGKHLKILAVRRLIKFSVFYIRFLRTCANIKNPKKNRTFKVRCIFWWERLECNSQHFVLGPFRLRLEPMPISLVWSPP